MKDTFGSETRIVQDNNSNDPIQTANGKMNAISHDCGLGRDFEKGKLSLEDVRNNALKNGVPAITSRRQ